MIIQKDNFQYEVPSTAVSSSPRWKAGLSGGLDFQSTGSGIAIEDGSPATTTVLRSDQPASLNQRVEMSINYSTTTTGSVSLVGPIAFYSGISSWVALVFDQLSRSLKLIETISSFDNLLLTLPYPANIPQVTFAATDAGTQGSWIGVYGSDGYDIEGYGSSIPGYASISFSGASTNTWASSTSDVRALQKAGSPSSRIAAEWFSGSSFSVNVGISDGLQHKVSFYLLDWNNTGASYRIDVIRSSDSVTLDSRTVSSLQNGLWIKWDISINCQFKFTALSGNAMLSGIMFDTVEASASCRLEIIQNRARVWYEASANGVLDRPPDAAINLKGTYSGQLDWGIYYNGDGTNNFRVLSFAAQDIASSAPTIPSVNISLPPSLHLTPVTATASGLGSPGQIHWQVSPADPMDFPETYEDWTDASITSHVLWVRPGYAYNYRVRLLTPDGYGPWTPTVQFSTGSKATTITPPVLEAAFPNVLPDYAMELTNTATPTMTLANTGHDRASTGAGQTRRTWKLVFMNREDTDYQQLLDFFDYRQGSTKPFTWSSPETGEVFAVHFMTDDPEITYNSQNTGSPVAQISFVIEEIDPNQASTTISLSLNLDPSVF